MKIEVIEYIEDKKDHREGFVDIKVIYSDNKYEIFRGLFHYQKEGARWLKFPHVKRGDTYLPYYERNPQIKNEILKEGLMAVEQHLTNVTHELPGYTIPTNAKPDSIFYV